MKILDIELDQNLIPIMIFKGANNKSLIRGVFSCEQIFQKKTEEMGYARQQNKVAKELKKKAFQVHYLAVNFYILNELA